MLAETDAAALAAIDAALARMDRGQYGICAVCGGEITRDRLRALPEAVECADCAELAESRPPRFTHRA
jgi:RNA polymerase-binding transcription factor DksA